MEPPLSALSQDALFCHRAGHFPSAPLGAPFPLMSRCSSSTLLTNLGLRYGPRQGPLRGLVPPSCVLTGSRPYRSMENLSWSPLFDPNLSGHCYRSVDSELILRYTSTSHWYDGPPDPTIPCAPSLHPDSLALYPRHCIPRKDVSLIPHFLLPGGLDEWDARKGLRDKLRLQSARSAGEATKALPMRTQTNQTPEQYGSINGKPTRITSHEEIKREVLRRLKLRRQNSSPNLALASSSGSLNELATSFTTDNIAGNRNSLVSEVRRPPLGRLHIPTFEEFKKMRQKEANGSMTNGSTAIAEANDVALIDLNGQIQTDTQASSDSSKELATSAMDGTRHFSPIRTVPSPRGPFQVLASSSQLSGASSKPRRSSLDTVGSVPFPPNRDVVERPSSCCPALLLEGSELSKYGAKIYKMKDGLIGSALDLIKKSRSIQALCPLLLLIQTQYTGALSSAPPHTAAVYRRSVLCSSSHSCSIQALCPLLLLIQTQYTGALSSAPPHTAAVYRRSVLCSSTYSRSIQALCPLLLHIQLQYTGALSSAPPHTAAVYRRSVLCSSSYRRSIQALCPLLLLIQPQYTGALSSAPPHTAAVYRRSVLCSSSYRRSIQALCPLLLHIQPQYTGALSSAPPHTAAVYRRSVLCSSTYSRSIQALCPLLFHIQPQYTGALSSAPPHTAAVYRRSVLCSSTYSRSIQALCPLLLLTQLQYTGALSSAPPHTDAVYRRSVLCSSTYSRSIQALCPLLLLIQTQYTGALSSAPPHTAAVYRRSVLCSSSYSRSIQALCPLLLLIQTQYTGALSSAPPHTAAVYRRSVLCSSTYSHSIQALCPLLLHIQLQYTGALSYAPPHTAAVYRRSVLCSSSHSRSIQALCPLLLLTQPQYTGALSYAPPHTAAVYRRSVLCSSSHSHSIQALCPLLLLIQLQY
uniref:Uncharacterized protein n=1 Tax=Knipowitschia caucasica TaxID=637954 RepID=A0AAV2JXD4_KNICA